MKEKQQNKVAIFTFAIGDAIQIVKIKDLLRFFKSSEAYRKKEKFLTNEEFIENCIDDHKEYYGDYIEIDLNSENTLLWIDKKKWEKIKLWKRI